MKTLGILEADTLRPDLKTDYLSYGHMFTQLFERLGFSLDYKFFHIQQGQFPTAFECDAYLITGSKAGVYDDLPWIAPLQEWIKSNFERKEKLIGICFGHQILAHSLGGFAAKSNKGWGVGLHTAQVNKLPVWAEQTPPELTLIYSHQDQVEQLPPAATRIAGSDFCENAAFFIDQQVLSFQGHPEFSVDFTHRLLSQRSEQIGADLLQSKLDELTTPKDADIVGKWLAKFIQG